MKSGWGTLRRPAMRRMRCSSRGCFSPSAEAPVRVARFRGRRVEDPFL
jgi:hypothetical protein